MTKPGKNTDSKGRSSISAFIICCNEAHQIRRCLESVKWCDEIIVVDSGSADNTREICAEFTSKIFERPWPGFVEQKRFALEQCKCEWVLNIDSDEEVSSLLKEQVLDVLSKDKEGEIKESGFLVPRLVFYMGKWWKKGGWHPEFRLRLCRRRHTTWGGDDPHEKALVSGSISRLSGNLHHFTYRDLADQLRSINSLSSSSARTLHAKGKRANLFDLISRPIVRFFKFYLIKRGFLEGLPGFIVAIMEAWGVFVKYSKLWEIEHTARNEKHKPLKLDD